MHQKANPRAKEPCVRLGRAWNPEDGPEASMLIQEVDEDDPRKGLGGPGRSC